MRTPIYSTPLKIALIVASGFALFFLGLFLSFGSNTSDQMATTITGIGWITAIYALTRIFRAEGEPADSRPWWKLTASTPLSWLCAALFIASGVQRIAQDAPVLGGVYIAFGALFIVNALRLRQG